jgi:hypothetical protein
VARTDQSISEGLVGVKPVFVASVERSGFARHFPNSSSVGSYLAMERSPPLALPANKSNRIRSRVATPCGAHLNFRAVRIGLRGVTFPRRQEQVRLDRVLLGIEIIVAAAGSVERLVRAALDNAPRFHHQNLISPANCREPVGNHEGGSATH